MISVDAIRVSQVSDRLRYPDYAEGCEITNGRVYLRIPRVYVFYYVG